MSRIYLETSFFSACVTTRPGPRPQGWRASSLKWWHEERSNNEIFISDEVVAELSRPSYPQSADALKLVQGLKILAINDDVRRLSDLLVSERVMPGPTNSGDALHIAIAIIHQIDYVLSWNVKHLANANNRTHLAIVCMRLGFVLPLVYTPDML